ncbi:LysR family transcriptional regulator [Zeimonas arvi]|uniref:LysR family transcriptional regulator n=1 Tax=Zeimonas arvi TaxID=2498847 RepID=A0A5C8P3T5_9BURK|nr:LysR family transcriptional regulator [Zeimonas arvi]TXL68326.1 LysR family transcriptional regulator [Zeimonas arvi]
MTTQRFDWTLIRSFLAVLEAGSLTGAARATGARQPTLSRHVAELEAQLGTALFERTGRGVVPTAAALAIADDARQMEEGALGLERALARQRDTATGVVRVTASQVAAVWLLPPLLAEFQAAEPGIQVELVASNALSNLLRREADIAVRMVRPDQGSLVARKLADVGIGAYAHRRYLARAGEPRRPEDLVAHRLVGYDRDETILRGFAALGLPIGREAFALRTDDHIAYGRLVAEGSGIGFLAHYTAAGEPELRRVLPQLKVPPMPCWLAVHREIRGNRVVRRVYDFLAARIPERLAELSG